MTAMNTDRLLIDEELIEDGKTIVLGISGGPDSVCLLFELLALGERRKREGGAGNPVVCAHVNHGLRGEESDGDEAWVAALCQRLGLPCEILRIDAAALAKEKGLTIEEAGREARYAFFDEVCRKYGDESIVADEVNADEAEAGNANEAVIAVAHNREDQGETILMRILRGTGTDGLAGMQKSRKSAEGYEIVRPLLGVSRKDIEARLAEYGEEARTDGSNSDAGYMRNKLRLEVFPYLEGELGVDLMQGLLRLAENAAEDRDFFDTVVDEALEEHLEYPEADTYQGDGPFDRQRLSKGPSPCDASPCDVESATMPAELLCGVHPAIRHRLIRAAFAELGLDRDIAAVHLAAAERLLRTWAEGGEASGKRVEFPQDYTFGIAGKKAVFRTPEAVDPGWKPRRKL